MSTLKENVSKVINIMICMTFMGCAGEDYNGGSSGNICPEINSITLIPSTIQTGDTILAVCDATDIDGDSIRYTWRATWFMHSNQMAGSFPFGTQGDTVTWVAPDSVGNCEITVTATDLMSSDGMSLDFVVLPPNNFPGIPSNPSPEYFASARYDTLMLSWMCSDPNPGDTLVYDLYLGADPVNPPLLTAGISTNSYQLTGLNPSTYYYWQIRARDLDGNITPGPVWMFRTVSPAGYVTVELDAFQDAFITDLYPDSTGNTDTLRFGLDALAHQWWIFLYFPIENIPSNAQIDTATLSLYAVASGGVPFLMFFKHTDTYWTENSLTWNNKPVDVFGNLTADSVFTDTSTWDHFDVKDVIKIMVFNQYTYGLILAPGASYFSQVVNKEFLSKETALKPHLKVVYHLP